MTEVSETNEVSLTRLQTRLSEAKESLTAGRTSVKPHTLSPTRSSPLRRGDDALTPSLSQTPLSLFWLGLVLGFSIAAPVGPIGVLCIQRTLSRGRRAGFVSGLGAATADGVYGLVAGLGLSAVSSLLVSFQTVIRLGGGLFLLYLGIRTFTAEPATTAAEADGDGPVSDYVSTFVLTLTNPVTILAFVGIFASVGIGTSGTVLDALTLVGGVVLGSSAWWLTLSTGVSLFRNRVTPDVLRRVNQLAGAVLVGFAVVVFASPG